MVSPRITRGGPARGRKLCSLTPYYPGVRKEDINLLNILLLLLLLLRNLLPQQHATSSIPSRSVTQSLPAGVWKSVSNLYPLHIMLLPPCWLLDFISHSTNPKIEFYYDRERHITRVKLYNVYVIYYHKGGSIYLGRRCWLDLGSLPYSLLPHVKPTILAGLGSNPSDF